MEGVEESMWRYEDVESKQEIQMRADQEVSVQAAIGDDSDHESECNT